MHPKAVVRNTGPQHRPATRTPHPVRRSVSAGLQRASTRKSEKMRIPFGKYRGAFINQLPTEYLEWLTTIDVREPLATKIKEEYERRLYDQSAIESPMTLRLVDEIISAGVRVLARTHHPDAGGEHDEMVAINTAADWLRERARAKISRLEAA